MTLTTPDNYSPELQKLSSDIKPGKTLLLTKHGYFLAINHDVMVSLSLIKYGELNELEWELMKPFIKPEMVVVDAGAHLGTFLVPIARRIGPKGKVIGFEPQPVIHESLISAISLNKITNADIHNCCIGNSNDALEIDEPDYTRIGHFSGLPFQEDYNDVRITGKKLQSRIERLDDVFHEPRLDFIKIDVEGMEKDVLLGARESIMKFRPVMFIENNRRDKSSALNKLVLDMGYRIWWHTGRIFNPDNHNRCDENVFGKMSNINVLCVPRERGDAEVPKGLIECTDAHHTIMHIDGSVVASIADYEPRLD
ncbi:MAG: FkbM family methyltransferase [Alphaproteobacteria bacterium]|nr:FkbM family methyltransferase [Alphaproteobacteria bacterium]